MSNETDIIRSIVQNPLSGLITLISVIIVAIISGIGVLVNYKNRPKLKFEAYPNVRPYNEKYYEVKFLIKIKNTGKRQLEHGIARLKITDPSGEINVVKSAITLNDDFQVPFLDEKGESHEYYDFSPSSRYEASIRIPIFIQLLKSPNVSGEAVMPSSAIMFDPPVEKWDVENTGHNIKYIFEVGIDVFISSTKSTFKKHFQIKIPQLQNSIVDPNKIEFNLE